MIVGTGLIPRNRLRTIPKHLRLAHEYSVGELASILILDETALPELYDLTQLLGSTPGRPKGLRVV